MRKLNRLTGPGALKTGSRPRLVVGNWDGHHREPIAQCPHRGVRAGMRYHRMGLCQELQLRSIIHRYRTAGQVQAHEVVTTEGQD